jgi:hypothetical protein
MNYVTNYGKHHKMSEVCNRHNANANAALIVQNEIFYQVQLNGTIALHATKLNMPKKEGQHIQ